MRILQIVTLFSPDSAYGGPVRVALNQSAALRARGHDVVVAGASRGFEVVPTEIDGVPVRLFPAATAVPRIGFAGMYAKGLQGWLRGHIAEFDVVHVHLARDFVTLPAARLAMRRGSRLVVQPHGMLDATDKLLAKPLDTVWTRPVLRGAKTVFYLTPREAADLTSVAGESISLSELHNGVPVADVSAVEHDDDPEVLFLARLHQRKRPDMFVRMAERLLKAGSKARFTLVGPDEGAGIEAADLIAKFGIGDRVTSEGAVAPEHSAQRLARSAVYVLPSIDEPYPMSVLEAMSVGLPVVVTDTCGLAPLIEETSSGIVVGADLDSLTAAVDRLLSDPPTARVMGANARNAAVARLDMDNVAALLESAYGVN